jgi:hypothetical protein
VLFLVFDLAVGEAQLRQADGGVGVVAAAVGRLLGRRAVIAQAVGLDHQPEHRPVEVDFVAVTH